MPINAIAYRVAQSRSFTARNKTNNQVSTDCVLDSNGIMHSVRDAAQSDTFGKRLLASLVDVPDASMLPDHMEWVQLNSDKLVSYEEARAEVERLKSSGCTFVPITSNFHSRS